MLQDIMPHVYHNEMRFRQPEPGDFVLHYREKGLLYLRETPDGVELPTLKQTGADETQLTYLFSVDNHAYDLLEGGGPLAETDGWHYAPTAQLRALEPGEAMFAAAVGESLYRWYRHQRFCGACGARMEKSGTERAMVCPACGNTVYPKICPAVICAVHDGDRLLLTRYRGRAFQKYALIAGFHEIGETIEDTVRREVMEETGVRVKNLRFYKSQPWVYTDSLLMGFFAELDGPDKITMQEDELSEAAWFRRSDIPADHSHISLTGEMIERFRQGSF